MCNIIISQHCFNLKVIDDPSGNSFIENPKAPLPDPAMTSVFYIRNKEQDHLVGIYEEELNEIAEEDEPVNQDLSGEKLEDEVLRFGTNCPSCNVPCDTNMKLTSN